MEKNTDTPDAMIESLKADIIKYNSHDSKKTDIIEIIKRISAIIRHFETKCDTQNPANQTMTLPERTSCGSRKKDYETILNRLLRRGGKYNYSKNVTRRRNYNKRKNKSQRYIRKDKKRK